MASSRRRRRARSRSTNKRRKTPRGATLPHDLVVEVLLRVPAAPLARLRRVCRSWDAEISSPGFQQRHHALASTKLGFLPLAPSHGVFVRFGSSPIERCISCHDCPRVIGSKPCHGLVLVYRPCLDEQAYSVWNPTTGEVLHLPFSDYPHIIIGMGFHAPAGEFKVVRVHVKPGKVEGRVITVGDSRGWRAPAATGNNQALFQDFTGYTTLDKHVPPVFADGFALPPFKTEDLVPYDRNVDHEHDDQVWDGRHGKRSSNDEEVHVPLGQTMAELDGRLCIMRDVRHRRDMGGSLFEIWKLQDYDAGSWSLDYRVDVTPGHVTAAERLTKPWLVVPLRYLLDSGRSSRKLLVATTAQEAHVYDPEDGTLRMVTSSIAEGGGNSDDSVRLLMYQESLFRLPGMKPNNDEIEFVQLHCCIE
ncbi:hypothetical protein QOZ80_3BG0262280 [Eleusine coracana subsp. coracana]|nr:hypothetical protein QOZ80_3BG0262280 [Eleusine coracana subsp. coracana]